MVAGIRARALTVSRFGFITVVLSHRRSQATGQKALMAEKLLIILPREMNCDRLARATQWTRGLSVDGEIKGFGITDAEDDLLVRLDLSAFPWVQQPIGHLSPVRRSAEPTHSAWLNVQLQPTRFFVG